MNLDDLRDGVVGRTLAREIASRSLALTFHPQGSSPASSFGGEGSWSLENLPRSLESEGTWTDVLDIDGRELFRDWRVVLKDLRELTVRIAADVGLGAAQVSVALSADGYRFQEQLERTRYHAARLGMPYDAVRAPVTCFAYPRLGLVNRVEGGMLEILEVGSDWLIRESIESLPPSPLAPSPRGSERDLLGSWLAGIALLDDLWSDVSTLPEAARKSSGTRIERVVPGVPHFKQKSPEYCVPAVAKMILNFHGILPADACQEKIADRMRTVRAHGSLLGGTALGDEKNGYESYLGSGKASIDEDLTFEDVRTQIDGVPGSVPRRPFKVGTGRHAMVVVGWRATQMGPELRDLQLGLHDPAGDYRWDWFSRSLCKNFVYAAP